METLLLQGESKKDIRIFAGLAKKTGLKARVISNADMEDIGLAIAMKKGRTKRYVNTETYLKKLRAK